MNAKELFLSDGKPAGVFYCGDCKVVHSNESDANQCCAPYLCKYCGKETGRKYWLVCQECITMQRTAKERAAFEASEKLTSWDGWVYVEGVGDEYFDSIEALINECECEDIPLPEYAWICDPVEFVKVDYDRLVQNFSEDAFEDFDPDDLNGVEEFKAAISRFEGFNKDFVSYAQNVNRSVLIHAPAKP